MLVELPFKEGTKVRIKDKSKRYFGEFGIIAFYNCVTSNSNDLYIYVDFPNKYGISLGKYGYKLDDIEEVI